MSQQINLYRQMNLLDKSRIVASNATPRTTAAGALVQFGTSTVPIVCDTADTKFLQIYTDSGATSGDNRSIYNRFYITGTGGGGESLRSYTDIVGVVAGTAHGAHISLGMGESTTGGAVTGLGVAMRATLGLPDVALASGGTYSAVQAEIYSFGASSDAGAVTTLSYFRVVNDGNSAGKATVDDDAFLFDLSGFTSGSAHLWYDHTSNVADESIKVKTPSGTRYLLLSDDTTF